MTIRSLPAFSLALALATLAMGQADGRTPELRFPLAAGAHTAENLLQMVGQVRGRPLQIDEAMLVRVRGVTFALQHELRLSRSDWLDVASMLLLARGIVLLHDGDDLRVVAAADVGPSQPRGPAVRTAPEVLQRPYRLEVVEVRAKVEADARVLLHSLRPAFSFAAAAHRIALELGDGGLTVRGLSTSVALALRWIDLGEGREPTATPSVAWTDEQLRRWPGGGLTAAELLKQMAAELDANVLWRPEHLSTEPLDLGATRQLAPRAWHAAAAAALGGAGLDLTVLHGGQRLFEVLPSQDELLPVLLARAAVLRPSEVLDTSLPLQPVVTATALRDAGFLAKVPVQLRLQSRVVICTTPGMLLLAGPSDLVRSYLELVPADVGK